MVASEILLLEVNIRPEKASVSSSLYTIVPNASDIPHCVTMRRAILVARSKIIRCTGGSSASMKTSSAIRPPNNTHRIENTILSMLVTIFGRQLHGQAKSTTTRDNGHLCTGSVFGNSLATTACLIRDRQCCAVLLPHHHRATLSAHHDFIFGALKIIHFDEPLVCRVQRIRLPR